MVFFFCANPPKKGILHMENMAEGRAWIQFGDSIVLLSSYNWANDEDTRGRQYATLFSGRFAELAGCIWSDFFLFFSKTKW